MPNMLDMNRLPKHIAIIMDGNGRWAQRRGLPVEQGHEAGAKGVHAAVEACRELGIKALTLYAFSTENWNRPQHEINTLFHLMSKFIRLELENIHRQGIRITIMGRYQDLDAPIKHDLDYCIEHTHQNKDMILNVAINYGSRREITDATRSIAEKIQTGKLTPADITENTLAQHLYVPDLPELDLMIRTSGEMRLSNFMLWQFSYAEFIPMRTLWPDFRKRHLHQAIATYQTRHRRFGGRQK